MEKDKIVFKVPNKAYGKEEYASSLKDIGKWIIENADAIMEDNSKVRSLDINIRLEVDCIPSLTVTKEKYLVGENIKI